ncbi:g7862 [Coccomyxa viridis]|uniref:G7862 protein n=1 Tax=Coccomyxa viridis TaxID=1274662 RepID=A0ABP1FYX2_9CHLO
MADPGVYNPFQRLPPAPVQQQPYGAPRGFHTDQQQQRIPFQNPNPNTYQMRPYNYTHAASTPYGHPDPLGPIEYKSVYDETNMDDPLTRFQDLEELDGIGDLRVREYHNNNACGPDLRAEGDLTSTFAESLVKNGIFCGRFEKFNNFAENNKATRADLQRLSLDRQRACRCAVRRRFAMAFHKKKGDPTFDHEQPLKIAEDTCRNCGQAEREMKRWGYLKHTLPVAEKHEGLKQLTLAVHELLTDGKDKNLWASYQGATDFEKICLYVWNEIVKHHSLLHNLRKSMPFEDFKELLKSIDAIAKADKHEHERKKAQTVQAKKLAHLRYLQRYHRLLLDQEKLKLHLMNESVGRRHKLSRTSRSSRSRSRTGKRSVRSRSRS